jgi:hypothetical protein
LTYFIVLKISSQKKSSKSLRKFVKIILNTARRFKNIFV